MTDKALILTVTRAQQGDARAFDFLVRHFQDKAVAYARTLLRDPAAAEDAAQEAFVQAWRDLPSLTEAAAFGAWLRRIVFKFCDRVRRSARPTLPLADTLPLPKDQEPPSVVERSDKAAQIHAAINALPRALREATLLHYLTGHDIQEIAAFLEVPPSTVKNRLHAARKRLRKELWTMAETMLEQEKPSQDERFAENVLARVLREFQRQEATDPQNANRGLLEEGRTALFEILGRTVPLDGQSLRNGFILLWRKRDWHALSTLLMRYLAQPLSDSETAWAYLHLADAIAMSGNAAGAVLAHEAFERWQPGKSPVLSDRWPYFPVSNDTIGSVYAGDEVRLLFLSKLAEFPVCYWNLDVWHNSESVEFITSFLKAWYNSDYLAKVDAVLSDIPDIQRHRRLRFLVVQQAANACVSIGDLDDTRRYVQQMHILAERTEDASVRAELKAQALGQEIHLARRKQDDAAFTARGAELTALLSVAALKEGNGVRWLREQRQALALEFMRGNRHDLALPLWEANAASGGQFNGCGWLNYAATIWKVTHDRERTLSPLRQARACEFGEAASENRQEGLIPMFTTCPEFAEVVEDAEFLQVLGRP